MPLRVSFRAFGCKLNQAEAESIAEAFKAGGSLLVPFGASADVVVVNTCTVTGKAEQKARRELRMAGRNSPGAAIIVTGCYAEMDPDALAALSPKVIVVPGSRKGDLVRLAEGLAEAVAHGLDPFEEARRILHLASGTEPDPFAFPPGLSRFRSRASLKVQDGCDNRCSYCRVCLARGHSVSLAPAEAVERARGLEASGYPEIVLTGVNLSQYRHGGVDFPGLLELLVRETDRVSFRISSYEPDRIDGSFLRAFSDPRVRPHLHLAVQSGSDSVLERMGRRYGRELVMRSVADARSAKGDPFIGMDMILGFPGEGPREFGDTLDLLEACSPAWIHAFTFSPRPGTPAFSLTPKVPERIAVERAAAVGDFARKAKGTFALRRVGRTVEAIVESAGTVSGIGNSVPAVTADYLKLRVYRVPRGRTGTILCRVIGRVGASAYHQLKTRGEELLGEGQGPMRFMPPLSPLGPLSPLSPLSPIAKDYRMASATQSSIGTSPTWKQGLKGQQGSKGQSSTRQSVQEDEGPDLEAVFQE